MPKSLFPKFWRTELDIVPPEQNPDISVDVQQTLDRLMVWDETNQIWRTAVCDIDGRLIISLSGVGINQATYNHMIVPVATTNLFPENSQRRLLMFENIGAVTIYVGFSAALTAANGWPLPVGGIYREDRYTGDIFMCGSGGFASLIAWIMM